MTSTGSTESDPVLDPFVLEHAPGPVVALHPGLSRLRAALDDTMATLGRIPDERLTALWVWDGHEVDVRYGFYRALESVERTAAEISRALAALPSSEARDAIGATTAARWELDGLLAGISDEAFDADPGSGEWTVRQTVGHIIGGQRGYSWGSAWWLSVRDEAGPDGPLRAPDEVFVELPSDEEEGRGTPDDVRRRVHDVVDATASRYATLTPEEMAVMARWSGIPVSIGFRMWRWPSHIEEHTVQVEKTLEMLGRPPSEVARLVRLIARAHGRLEQQVMGRDPDQVDSMGTVATSMDRLASALSDLAPQVRAAADAGVPASDW